MGYEFYPEIRRSLKYYLNQPRVYSAAKFDTDVLLPELITFLNNMTYPTEKDFKKREFKVQLIYSENYLDVGPLSNEVNIVWKELQSSEVILNSLSEQTETIVLPNSHHDFPIKMILETRDQIESFASRIGTMFKKKGGISAKV